MEVAFVVYDDMTALDFVGAYDPVVRMDEYGGIPLSADVCAMDEPVATNGLMLQADRIAPALGTYDLLVVPGGRGTRELRHDAEFIEWLRTAEDCEYLASVCTGSLLLGAAGFLAGKRATTHPNAVDLLAEYATVVDDRVVQDGRVITGRGVSSSLDLGLYLVELVTDRETRATIAEQMDYPYGGEIAPD